MNAQLYVTDPAHVDSSLRPCSRYLALVVDGARYHQLPRDYVAWLEAVPCGSDPDRERERRRRAFSGRRG